MIPQLNHARRIKKYDRWSTHLRNIEKIRAVDELASMAIKSLNAEKFDIDALIERLTISITNARQITSETEEMLIIGEGGNADDAVYDILNSPAPPMLKTGYTAYDNKNGGLPIEGVMLVAATTSGGKCIRGNCLVPTSRGLLRMDEMWAETDEATNDQGFRDFAIDLYSHEGIVPSTRMYKTTGTTLKMVTDTGHNIEGLGEHKIWIYDTKSFEFVFKRLDELDIGDAVPRTLGSGMHTDIVPTIDVDSINKKFSTIRSGAYRPGNFIVAQKLPTILTKNLARLLGYLVSEGNGLRIANTDPLIMADIVRCASDCFCISSVLLQKSGNVCSLQITHLQLFFEAIGYTNVLSDKQKIPRIIREAPREYQIEFLRSLFEGDGSIYSDSNKRFRIEYMSISKRLTNELLVMLENLGIACHVRRIKTWAANGSVNRVQKNGYQLFIEKSHMHIFIQQVGFIGVKKRERSDNYIMHRHVCDAGDAQNTIFYTTGFTNYLPARTLVKELLETIRLEIPLRPIFGRVTESLLRGRKISRYMVRHLLKFRDDVIGKTSNPRISNLYERLAEVESFVYSTVKSVKSTNKVKPVYDFFVPGPHSYAVNCLMSHNSTMLLNLLRNIYKVNKVSVAKISFEMSKRQEVNRLLSNISSIHYTKFAQGLLTKDDKRNAYNAHVKFNKFGIKNGCRYATICPEKGMTIEDVFITMKPFGFNVIGIDYVSLLKGVSVDNMWRIMGEVCAKAKMYSRANRCLVILLCQLDDDTDKIRYSNAMKENADVVWHWNYSKEEVRATHVIEINTSKARDGELIKFPLAERFEFMQVENPSDNDEDPGNDDDDDNLIRVNAGVS